MLLVIDYRERAFLNTVNKHQKDPNQVTEQEQVYTIDVGNVNVDIKVANLEVGDFVLKDNDDVLLIIERKTVTDLCASITDGRFRQQKERLIQSVNDDYEKVLFIIEGPKVSKPMVDGAILNMMYKHKFRVLATKDMNDTFNNVILLYKKFAGKEFSSSTTSVVPVKLQSKRNKIDENIMAVQLSAIPGVSYSTALKIANIYPTMQRLVTALGESGETSLAMIEIERGGKASRLGKAIAKKIFNAICTEIREEKNEG
jgi:ERCC4-type nuclease